MATNQTTNYQLNQWEPTDAVQRVDFNADNAKVDAALKSLSDQVVQKANQSALNTVISAVNQKADAATVSSLSQVVAGKAEQSDVDALANKAGTQLLKRFTLSAAQDHYYIDLSDIDWSQWATVTIRLRPALKAGDSFRIYCHMDNTLSQITDNEVTQAILLLFPLFDADAQVMGLYFPGTYEGNGLLLDYIYAQLEKLELGSTDYDFQQGSVFEVWGTK